MPEPSSDRLLAAIEQSELIDPSAFQAAVAELRDRHQGRLPHDPAELAHHFQQRGLLTDWHIAKLLSGKSRGFRLGTYKLLRHIGRGGMGSVYLAEHMGMQRKVAIKVLPPALVQNRSYLERFQREARVAAALDHVNIVRAFDFGNSGDLYYLVMEFVDGADLATRVQGSPGGLPVGQAVDIIIQATRGLQHAHDRGVIHRDVKPSNLLIDANGCVKLLDLGLARHDQGEQGSVTMAHRETILGTADYLAPEQALDCHTVDCRADIYSLGCTLYFALAGHPPFPDGTLAQRIAQHQHATPKPLSHIRPEISEQVDLVCQRMMAKSPADRYQSSDEVAEALQMAVGCLAIDGHEPPLDGLAEQDPFPPIDVDASNPRQDRVQRHPRAPVRSVRRGQRWIWLLLAILCLVACILAVLVWRRSVASASCAPSAVAQAWSSPGGWYTRRRKDANR